MGCEKHELASTFPPEGRKLIPESRVEEVNRLKQKAAIPGSSTSFFWAGLSPMSPYMLETQYWTWVEQWNETRTPVVPFIGEAVLYLRSDSICAWKMRHYPWLQDHCVCPDILSPWWLFPTPTLREFGRWSIGARLVSLLSKGLGVSNREFCGCLNPRKMWIVKQ